MRRLFFWLVFIGPLAHAGSFDSYEWHFGVLPAQGHYQVTLKISYDYRAGKQFNPAELALPQDDNLKLFKLLFKVDGTKVEPQTIEQVTWWSYGQPVPTWLPEREGNVVKAEAFYIIKNLFLVPPAPTTLPIDVKNLRISIAPVQGLDVTGSFIGQSFKFKPKKIASDYGRPTHAYEIVRKNLSASREQGLMFLMLKTFTFSFEAMRAEQWDPKGHDPTTSGGPGGSLEGLFGGTGGFNEGTPGAASQDTAAGHKGFSITGDLKQYSANFYKGNPNRDWVFALTWLQQERTYLPFGIQPGGAVKSRSLFLGAGDQTDDLVPWIDPLDQGSSDAAKSAEIVKAPAEPNIEETNDIVANIESFLIDFRKAVQVNQSMSRLVAYEHESNSQMSPALANRHLANELKRRFGVETAPALTSIFPQDRIAAMPLSAFDRIITALKIGKNWFFVDAATPAWTLSGSMAFLKDHSIVILGDEDIQMGHF